MNYTKQIGKNHYRTAFSFDKSELFNHHLQIDMSGVKYEGGLDDAQVKDFRSNFEFDYGKYDPTIVPEALQPKPEDFIPFPFRLITATIIAGNTWRATEFPPAILKASVSKLADKPVFEQHWTSTQNLSGLVKNPVWSPQRKEGGVVIPGGIDGVLAIDSKLAPKLARSMLMGGIYSNSVTVIFDWKMSHDFSDIYEFRNKVGEMHEDKTMIRRVATKIHEYQESSVVFMGADPFAKLRGDDGKLVHVDQVNNYHDSFSLEDDKVKNKYEKGKSYFVSCGFDKDILHLSKIKYSDNPTTVKPIPENNKKNMNPEIFKLILMALGLPESTTQEQFTADQAKKLVVLGDGQAIVNLSNATGATVFLRDGDKFEGVAVSALTAENVKAFDNTFVAKALLTETQGKVTTLTVEKSNLQKQVTEKEELAKIGESFMSSKRAEVIRLYKAGTESPDETIIGLFEKANAKELESLLKQHVKNVAELTFKGKCQDCGSSEFTFQSSLTEKGGEGVNNGEGEAVVAFGIEAFRKDRNSGSGFLN